MTKSKIQTYIKKLRELQDFLERNYINPADNLFENNIDPALDDLRINTYWTKSSEKKEPPKKEKKQEKKESPKLVKLQRSSLAAHLLN